LLKIAVRVFEVQFKRTDNSYWPNGMALANMWLLADIGDHKQANIPHSSDGMKNDMDEVRIKQYEMKLI
jgi:hypothetical protein